MGIYGLTYSLYYPRGDFYRPTYVYMGLHGLHHPLWYEVDLRTQYHQYVDIPTRDAAIKYTFPRSFTLGNSPVLCTVKRAHHKAPTACSPRSSQKKNGMQGSQSTHL